MSDIATTTTPFPSLPVFTMSPPSTVRVSLNHPFAMPYAVMSFCSGPPTRRASG